MEALRKKYKAEGWLLAKLDKIEDGGAPMLEGANEKIILLDDLLVHPVHGMRFSDGKYKDHADLYQKGSTRSMSTDGKLRQWQHGIDLHHWDAYRRIQDLTKVTGQLSLLVLKPGAEAMPNPHHLWQSLAELEKHAQIRKQPHTRFRRGAVYFPMDAWKCSAIDFAPPDTLPSLATSRNPWEQKSKTGYAPAWEINYCADSPFERHYCAICGKVGGPLFGYKQQTKMNWYCIEHRLGQHFSDSYYDPKFPLFSRGVSA